MSKSRKIPFIIAALILLSLLLPLQQACDNPPSPPAATPLSSTVTAMSPSILEATPAAALAKSLSSIIYLGEGSGSYSADPNTYFLVKRTNPFRFDREEGPTYEATNRERVWQANGAPPIQVYEDEISFDNVWAGCEVNYVQIDDDEDGRRNRWYVNGTQVHQMEQGMVVYGRFTINDSGNLTLRADDSIGANIDVSCPDPPTKTPPPTSTATATMMPPSSTPTQQSTNTATPTPIKNVPQASTSTPTAVFTAVSTPVITTPTPTGTAVPPSTATMTPIPSPTVPQGPAYTRFNFEQSGHTGRNGTCFMHRVTGELLLVWEMQDGWTDSSTHPLADAEGWIEVDIPHPSIYVEVYCDAGEGIVRMNIHNGVVHPESGKIVGWLTRGIRNAIEIGWP